MLGSDCSGMGTDVVAAKQLGIEFMVQFATDVDPDLPKGDSFPQKGTEESWICSWKCLREAPTIQQTARTSSCFQPSLGYFLFFCT